MTTALAIRTQQTVDDKAPVVVRKDPNERLVEYLSQCWQEGEDATTDRQSQWRELWNAYQGRQDNKYKAKWQSQLFVPKVWVHVEKASGEIRRAMLQTQKLFKLELDDSEEKGKISGLRRRLAHSMDELPRLDDSPEAAQIKTYQEIIGRVQNPLRQQILQQAIGAAQQSLEGQYIQGQLEHARRIAELTQSIRGVERDLKDQFAAMALDDARFKSDLQRTNLARAYSEMVKVAFLLGVGIIKVGWDSARKRVIFKNIDPFNFHVCPDWEPTSDIEPSWVMERVVMPLPDLYEAAKRRNKKVGEDVYDLKAIEKLNPDYVPENQDEQDRRRGITPRVSHSGKIELRMFWGDVPKADWRGYDGRGQFIVVANEREIIRKGRNPFTHGKAPYILTMPLTYPFRGHSGSSLVEPIVRMNYTYNNVLNLYVDGLTYTVNKQFQVDPTKLRDPRQMNTVFPGKIWKVKSGADNRPVLQEIPVAPMSADALRAAELLSHDIQESTGVTEFLQGMPRKGAKTLGEIQSNIAESRGMFDVTARDMESYSLQPLLEMAYDVCVQCMDYPDREGRYHVLANGLSSMIGQGQLLEAIGSILELVLKSPVIAAMTKIPDVYQRLLSIHNLLDCYKEPSESAAEALTPEQQNAIATQVEQDAKGIVGQMSPEQIQEMAP